VQERSLPISKNTSENTIAEGYWGYQEDNHYQTIDNINFVGTMSCGKDQNFREDCIKNTA
jgi:hypothetical protein